MRSPSGRRRVVITGLGAVTAFGPGVAKTWDAIIAGRSGITAYRPFGDPEVAEEIAGRVDLLLLPPLDQERTEGLGRAARFGLAAAHEAYGDAGLQKSEQPRSEMGVCIGASTFPVVEDRLDRLGDLLDGNEWDSVRYAELCRERPWLLTQSDAAGISSLISDELHLEGPSLTVQAACTSATQAIGHALQTLRSGQGSMVLAGGTDSMLSMMCVTGFTLLGSLAQRWSTPAEASRPFDRTRDGFVLAEGAAMLVLEDLEHALGRGARIYAELIGYGSSCDAYRFTDIEPTGRGAVLAMARGLEDAGLAPEAVGYINAHGTATQLNDRIETHAIRDVFGKHADRVAVSSTKSQLGHLLCAAGAIELLLTTLAVHHGILPPTLNLRHPDPECNLDCISSQPRPRQVDVAMSNSFGFGGQNGSLLVRRWVHDETSFPSKSAAKAIEVVRQARSRVCVTGIGVVSSLGLDLETHLSAWRDGFSGIAADATREMRTLGVCRVGRVRGFAPQRQISNRMLRKLLMRPSGYAVAAAGEALQRSQLEAATIASAHLFVGCLGLDQDLNVFGEALRLSLESGPSDGADKEVPALPTPGRQAPGCFSYRRFQRHGMAAIDPLFLVRSLPNAGLCGTAIEFGMQGPNLNIMNGSTSGLLAVSAAADAIARRDTSVALAGGYDSLLPLETFLAHLLQGRLQTCAGDGTAHESSHARGYLPGEGAVFFVLEEVEHAKARGVRILAEVLGSGVTHANPGRETEGLERAARISLRGVAGKPSTVFGDGLCIAQHDLMEADVLRCVCAASTPPVCASVDRLGFSGAAAGLFSMLHATDKLQPMLYAEDTELAPEGLTASPSLVWTSDLGRNHVAVALRRYSDHALAAGEATCL